MSHYYALIMAGGGGTRLWPMSRSSKPKQLLPLIEDYSMFRVSVERLAPLFPPENIYVVAGRQHVDDLRKDAPMLPAENFIVEPYGKDNGPAALLAISVIYKRDPEAVIAYLTSDHHITNKNRFRRALAVAGEMAQTGKIVTLGITPNMPSTGYGYIQRGSQINTLDGFEIYESLGFHEKPNLELAIQYLESGDYDWNSGMFIWTAKRALSEFRAQQPEMMALIDQLTPTIDTPDFERTLTEIWEPMKKISIDFAVMEGASDMVVIPVDIGWNDVGSWASLYEVLEHDDLGNSSKGDAGHVLVDTKNTLVYSDKLTVTIGIENVVIVDTDDVLMVCHRDRTQDVREVVNRLREADQKSYL